MRGFHTQFCTWKKMTARGAKIRPLMNQTPCTPRGLPGAARIASSCSGKGKWRRLGKLYLALANTVKENTVLAPAKHKWKAPFEEVHPGPLSRSIPPALAVHTEGSTLSISPPVLMLPRRRTSSHSEMKNGDVFTTPRTGVQSQSLKAASTSVASSLPKTEDNYQKLEWVQAWVQLLKCNCLHLENI